MDFYAESSEGKRCGHSLLKIELFLVYSKVPTMGNCSVLLEVDAVFLDKETEFSVNRF